MKTTTTSVFQPSEVLQAELSEERFDLARLKQLSKHARLSVLVRLHGHPMANVHVNLADIQTQQQLDERLWSVAGEAINRHLVRDGMAPLATAPKKLLEKGVDTLCWAGMPQDSELPLVSVVIATKDRTEVLLRCLKSLKAQDYPDFEIIIVENGASNLSTAERIQELYGDDPSIRYLHEAEPGVSHARNTGLREARGEIVAFTDDDVIVDSLWLRALVRRFSLRPDLDCVTGLVVPAQNETQAQEWFEEFGGFNKGFRSRVFTHRRFAGSSLLYPFTAGTFGSGNNAAFRRRALIRRGAFDENLGPGTPTRSGEDLDVFLNVVLDGGAIGYEPAAIVSHFHRYEYEALVTQLRDYGVGLSAMLTKHFLNGPRNFARITLRLPLGAFALFSSRSKKNNQKSHAYPDELSRAELLGLLRGPLKYFKSYF